MLAEAKSDKHRMKNCLVAATNSGGVATCGRGGPGLWIAANTVIGARVKQKGRGTTVCPV